jgi:hypothetical protein
MFFFLTGKAPKGQEASLYGGGVTFYRKPLNISMEPMLCYGKHLKRGYELKCHPIIFICVTSVAFCRPSYM